MLREVKTLTGRLCKREIAQGYNRISIQSPCLLMTEKFDYKMVVNEEILHITEGYVITEALEYAMLNEAGS